MDLKQKYLEETGWNVDTEIGSLGVLYYSEEYVKWLESKLNNK